MRVLLIGGTSNTGKSTVARLLADRLGFDCHSTALLARHPGRPWPTPTWTVPPHVREHYATLGVDDPRDARPSAGIVAGTRLTGPAGGAWQVIRQPVASSKAIFGKTGVRSRGELVRQIFVKHYVPRWEQVGDAPSGRLGFDGGPDVPSL